jgi:hypothetical protein
MSPAITARAMMPIRIFVAVPMLGDCARLVAVSRSFHPSPRAHECPIEQRPVVLVIFVLTYVVLAIGRIPGLRLNRTGIALLGAIAMMIFSGSSTEQIAASVNWPTIFLLFGFFVISAQLRLSGFFDRLAAVISQRLKDPTSFMLYLVVTTAGLSAFLNNDIVCYVLTPVVAAALVQKGINPVAYLIALAAASNIGGAATLIGHSQNMVIGTLAGLSFLRYLLWSLVPVAVGVAVTFLVARLAHRGGPPELRTDEIDPGASATYALDRYHAAKGAVILAAVIALFFTPVPREVTVLVAACMHLLSTKFRTDQLLALVDWHILLMFMALFVVSAASRPRATGSSWCGGWMASVSTRAAGKPGCAHRGPVGSDRQRTGRDAPREARADRARHERLRHGGGQQLRRQCDSDLEPREHHRGPAGAPPGDRHLFRRLRPPRDPNHDRNDGRPDRLVGDRRAIASAGPACGRRAESCAISRPAAVYVWKQ